MIVEYVFQDNKGNFRSKFRVLKITDPKKIPTWNYDGSSTGQRDTHSSEVKLYPSVIYQSCFLESDYVAMCNLNPKNYVVCSDHMFGFEQEAFLIYEGLPLSRNILTISDLDKYEQSEDYCNTSNRQLELLYLETVCKRAMSIGLNITGYNLEVAPGQVEIQLCETGIHAADSLMMLRFIMIKTANEGGAFSVSFHPKPFANLNGSGMHTNFSTSTMRKYGLNDEYLAIMMNVMKKCHGRMQPVSGKDNELRLTGECEASNIDEFSFGYGDRLASVRLPPKDDIEERNYIEDRRWGANADPYEIVHHFHLIILKTNLECMLLCSE